ncbi:DUF6207 family protein [Streptomyces sp. NPDC048248]|uniref:DUF6207 family protein n=1 Tax=Streptomyces sp. NPDC048248 TaxID=3365523 RepID=UPI0037153A1B
MECNEDVLHEPGLVVIDITAADEETAPDGATLGGLWRSNDRSAPWHPRPGRRHRPGLRQPAPPSLGRPICSGNRVIHLLP